MLDYIGIGKIRIDIRDLRKLVGIQDGQYKDSFAMFKARVLEKAIDEINKKTDLHIQMDEPERVGRKVVSVSFQATMKETESSESKDNNDLVQQLV